MGVAAGCGDDGGDGDRGEVSTEQQVQVEFVDLPGQQQLTLEVAPSDDEGTASFDSSEPAFGGELTPNNLTEITGGTLSMQTFAPLRQGTLTVGVDVSDGVAAIRLSVRPVPQGSSISAGAAGGELQPLQAGETAIDLAG